MVGTTNRIDWHKDDTGGRRFWPIECTADINLEWLISNREQLFAEAKALYDLGTENGGAWWDVPIEDQKRQIAAHYQGDDPLVERLEQWLQDDRFYTGPGTQKSVAGDPQGLEEWEHWGNVITTSRIMTVLMQMPIERQHRNTGQRVAQAMRKLGWTQKVIRAGSGRGAPTPRAWVKTSPGDSEQGKLFDNVDE
jgi:predicted P-loop ATPase